VWVWVCVCACVCSAACLTKLRHALSEWYADVILHTVQSRFLNLIKYTVKESIEINQNLKSHISLLQLQPFRFYLLLLVMKLGL
jgi:hypothetical protein